MEILLLLLACLLGVGAAAVLWAGLRRERKDGAEAAFAAGDFVSVLREFERDPQPGRRRMLHCAIAAKSLLQLERAAALLDRLLAADEADGEAWLERGLVHAYAREWSAAEQAFLRAAVLRPDLLEPLTLHRAWTALGRGDLSAARSLFEEIAAPLESKLRTDLGTQDPLFAEWLLQAGALWHALGEEERAQWASKAGRQAAPQSRLPELLQGPQGPAALTQMAGTSGPQPGSPE